MNNDKTVIGRTVLATFVADRALNVPAKVDTGADSSSIWASNAAIGDDGYLRFSLFAPESKYYTGRIHKVKEYTTVVVRSSNGHEEPRFRVQLSVKLAGRLVRGTFTLADRARNQYPILIGCRLLRGKFLVDVSRN